MCLIFVGQGYPRKLFNLEHFPIYGISSQSLLFEVFCYEDESSGLFNPHLWSRLFKLPVSYWIATSQIFNYAHTGSYNSMIRTSSWRSFSTATS